ncbi:hypothetical protein BSPLISOX_2519 [uncultured Gammaproteobacteria bacterium]|nr:hypothetical protein BSPLISOX_2519 [uncultured Gammaproteobacteria bacterium]
MSRVKLTNYMRMISFIFLVIIDFLLRIKWVVSHAFFVNLEVAFNPT